MIKQNKFKFRTMLAAIATGIFCVAALPVIVCGLPFEGESDRLKYVSAEAEDWAITLVYGADRQTFRIGVDESALRGMPDTRPATVRAYLDLIAVGQGFGRGVAVGCVLPRTLFAMENWLAARESAPVDARVETRGRGFAVRPDRDGCRVNREAFYAALYETARTGGGIVTVRDEPVRAAVRAETLREEIGYRAAFSTSIASSSAARKTNVALALACFDGMTVAPGETVSFNEVVGPRTEERGYRTAKIILDGRYVDGVGGGVCQASTTLYNALVLGGVRVDRAHHHTLAPSYVPPSRDAMVNSVGADLVFTNTTGRNLHLRTFVTSSTATACVFGAEPEARYRIESEITGTIPAPEPSVRTDDGTYAEYVTYDDETLTVKNGHDGLKSRAWLIRETALGTSRTLLRTDVYAPLRGEAVRGRRPASERPAASDPLSESRG